MNRVNANCKILIYFVATFLITWLLWLPGVLASQVSISLPEQIIFPLVILGTFVPSVMGIIFVRQEKQSGILRRW
ncbi:MAG: hypothetical protein JXM69_07675, partial [Anaerolineae bacterium]|nr:hypothetical protein [Anaerolineae bacterium]